MMIADQLTLLSQQIHNIIPNNDTQRDAIRLALSTLTHIEANAKNAETKLETAACLWEHALSLLSKDNATPLTKALNEWRERDGFAGLRLDILGYVDECEAEWASVQNTYTNCYDWDFVPAFLERKLKEKLEV